MPFVTLEGIEGCGKSTQARRLAEALGDRVLLTREPGGTPLGQGIRALLLDAAHLHVVPEAEVLLFFADRAQHVREVLRPALAEGRLVISDRYLDSSLAYQGHGRRLSLELLQAVAELATGGLRPDLSLLLDLPVEAGLARLAGRGAANRLDAEPREFHERVREGYERLVQADPGRWARVDARGTEDAVTERLLQALRARGLCGAVA